jgi:hypothetical protein
VLLCLPPPPFPCQQNARSSDYVAPLTSFDWNDLEPRRLATCSIDTSVTVWDVERGAAEAQVGGGGGWGAGAQKQWGKGSMVVLVGRKLVQGLGNSG